MDPTERFRALVARPEAAIPLDEAALLLAAHAKPDLDVAAHLAAIDAIADTCSAPTLDALVRHLFVDLGFHGNRSNYYDARNSYLDDVIARRTGIPITLSVLMISVGRRLGVPLAGVGLPGHFLVRDQVDPDLFVDPFDGGRMLDRHGCQQAFRRVHGSGARFDPAFLQTVGSLTILARMLANLRAIFAAHADHESLLWVIRLRASLPDATPDDRSELASALAARGAFDEAADELERLADAVDGALATSFAEQAVGLRARLN